jgi:hypothetical protein
VPRKRPAGTDPLAGSEPTRPRCTAQTSTGARCRRKAAPGLTVCARCADLAASMKSRQRRRPVKPPKSPGRPTKLTKDVEDKIVEILKLGGYAETAAQAAGISVRTFRLWIQRGDPEGTKKVDAPYRRFRAHVDQVVAEALANNIALIRRAAQTDWKAAAWLAEREHPDKYAGPRGRRLDSSHPDDFASGEKSAGDDVKDDQVGPDGRPL